MSKIVKLSFDPQKSVRPFMKEVFENRIARNIWIGYKRDHVTSQFFTEDCLRIAEAVAKEKPKNLDELLLLLSRHGRDGVFAKSHWNDKSRTDFVIGLLPYILGEEYFEYEILVG